MKYLLALLFAVFVLAKSAFAYPQAEFDDCINSTKENPELANISDESVQGFCDCALTEIFDKNRIDNLWINACARSNFQ